MTHDELLHGFKSETASAPPGARERVWRRLDGPKRPEAALPWLALAGAAVAAAAIAVVALRPVAPPPLVPMYGEGFVVLAPAGAVTRSGGVLELHHGTAYVSSWGGRVELAFGKKRVTTDAAVFAASVAPDVALAVQQGAVLADGERVEARAKTAVDFAPLRAVEPKEAEQERAWVLAENAAADGRIAEAIERFAALSAYSSLRAEAALLRKAQLELWSLKAPGEALRTLGAAAGRFPSGALQQERAFSELEAYVEQRDWRAAAERAASFLKAWPDSERRAEVEKVAAAARSFER